MTDIPLRANPSGKVQWPFECGQDLSAGDPVYIYDDAGTAKVKKVYSSLNLVASEFRGYYHDSCMLDSTHVVAVYRDMDNSNHVYVQCGEIQPDKTINWGAKVLVYANYGYYLGIDKLDSNRFIVMYRGPAGATTVKVGEVVGTVITVEVNYFPVSVGYGYDQSVCFLDTNLFVVGFRDSGALNYGHCRIGSVDPITKAITMGVAERHSAAQGYDNWVCKPDPASAKFAVFFRQNAGGTIGSVRASTYTGTLIDGFGLSIKFGDYPYYTHAESIGTDKVAVIYRDSTDGNKGKMIVGTFAGTTPHFDLADVVTFSEILIYYPTLCKLQDDEFQIAWMKYASPYQGLTAKCTVSGTAITKEGDQCYENERAYYNSLAQVSDGKYFLLWYGYTASESSYIVVEGALNLLGYTSGLMQESGLLGETKNVDLIGGISEALTGMVAGEHMYVQCDASISPALTDYHIGLALEATKMLIDKTG